MYVVPANGTDNQLDTNGTIEQSIERFQNWLLRPDRKPGSSHRHLPRRPGHHLLPHAAYRRSGDEPDPVAAGHDRPRPRRRRLRPPTRCTPSSTTATAPGPAAVGTRRWGSEDWRDVPAGMADPRPGAVPRLGHRNDSAWVFRHGDPARGAAARLVSVPPCAPHLSQDGYHAHVNDSPTDIMYRHPTRLTLRRGTCSHAVLDYNHDDYYRAHIPGCYDLSRQPLPDSDDVDRGHDQRVRHGCQ